ncbi:peptidylprolyl isomerase [Subsaxibacter sp. CAU 1640]|uniref:peptidylprolyl isomerase n=1 Tax=Subsaxibacter sp. CAU 1640 TaxID=2933271 RepID=UPI002003A009|nr:peptidylprolyl isomerase [Subsaxibacter sp. CAU 1640]MCK7590899.1 peptidylprolyl isomerase [Subsaxibacter sp. CAU 1640]
MFRHLLYTAFLVFTVSATAQKKGIQSQLDSIQNETQATKFIETNKSNKGKLYVFNKEKHKTQLAKDLFKMGKGSSKVIASDIQKTHYKIIDKYEIPYYRYSYVYFDGSKKSKEEIKDLQNRIISKYQQGFRFGDLAKMYSMDANANRGGDLGWITTGNESSELEAILANDNHNVEEIFAFDLPEKNSFYVAVKTHPTKLIEEIKVLEVTETLN